MFIQTEATPNPATIKFIPGKTVLGDGTVDFRSREEAALSPLAQRLFAVDGVSGVFLGSDFISVTKGDSEWQHLKPAILGAIMEHYISGAPVLEGDEPNADDADLRGLRRRGRGDRRHHQGADRDPRPPLRCQRRRRYRVPRLPRGHRLPAHARRLRRLPVARPQLCRAASSACLQHFCPEVLEVRAV